MRCISNMVCVFAAFYCFFAVCSRFLAVLQGELFRMNRSLMMSSGTTVRIAELMQQLDEFEEIAAADGSAGAADSTGAAGSMQLAGVDLDSPAGGRLLTGLTLDFPEGENLLVCGDNGRGKTSIFRALKGLWPVAAGQVVCCDASPSRCLYLPQTPYVVRNGSLQDQVTFPLQLASGSVDAEQLGELLALVSSQAICRCLCFMVHL